MTTRPAGPEARLHACSISFSGRCNLRPKSSQELQRLVIMRIPQVDWWCARKCLHPLRQKRLQTRHQSLVGTSLIELWNSCRESSTMSNPPIIFGISKHLSLAKQYIFRAVVKIVVHGLSRSDLSLSPMEPRFQFHIEATTLYSNNISHSFQFDAKLLSNGDIIDVGMNQLESFTYLPFALPMKTTSTAAKLQMLSIYLIGSRASREGLRDSCCKYFLHTRICYSLHQQPQYACKSNCYPNPRNRLLDIHEPQDHQYRQ